MTDYKMVDVKEQPYLYAERTCSMDPRDISANMGAAFQAVGELMARKGIASASQPLSAYYTYDPQSMTFRAGFLVSGEDAKKAEGDVRADVLPAGKVLNYIHHGAYSKLRDGYDEMMEYLAENGMKVSAPTWEIYLNDPGSVASEDDLETDIYVTVEED